MPQASHSHVGHLRSVRVSGFRELALNGSYDLVLEDPAQRVYQQRAAGGAPGDPDPAALNFDGAEGRWVLRSPSGHALRHDELGTHTPVGKYGGGRVAVGAALDWQSPLGHLAFPAPRLHRDFYTENANGLGPRPLLAHPGLIMLACGGGDGGGGNPERVPAVLLRLPTVGSTEKAAAVDAEGYAGGARVLTVLYSHGNDEDLGMLVEELEMFGAAIGAHVFAYDYVGYSTSQLEGDAPSEAGCLRAITAAWEYLIRDLGVSPGDIVLYGRSIGSGPTCDLASRLGCRDAIAGVILQSPIYSWASVVLGCGWKRTWLAKPFDIFRNYEKLPLVSRPVAILHGTWDEIVPAENGVWLHGCAFTEGTIQQQQQHHQQNPHFSSHSTF